MNPQTSHLPTKTHVALTIAILAATGGGLFLTEYRYKEISAELAYRNQLVASSTAMLESKINAINDVILVLSKESETLKSSFEITSSSVGEQISRVHETVNTLDKLSRTDPELLAKYSKVYFLNEHYTPRSLTDIPSEYLFNKQSTIQVHGNVWPYLSRMLKAAKDAGVDLQVISGYRSYKTQSALKSGYKVIYGAGTANEFSADQGYSEHQLGTTLDFTTASVGASFNNFDKTPAFVWLREHAHTYGFALSYPPNNKYYIYEPWHWRFVGIDLASRLKREDKYFYDLDQREIDNYLLLLFN